MSRRSHFTTSDGPESGKIHQEPKDFIEDLLVHNCLLTTEKVTRESNQECARLQMSLSTLSTAMHGLWFTVKKV